jgi:hypothetical protein
MNTPTVRLSRFSAAACATAITAVSAWSFVSSSASIDRDPYQFAAIMAKNADAHLAQTAASQRDRLPQQVRVSALPGLVAPVPVCVGPCS